MQKQILSMLVNMKKSSFMLANLSTQAKNDVILSIAKEIDKMREEILAENQVDVQLALHKGVKESLLDRLILNQKRIDEMIEACETVAKLKDPIGEVVDSYVREDGLKIYKVRVPIGVIAVIYESRPNVTVETAVLALKSGNVILLKGGSDAINSNKAIVKAIKNALANNSMPESFVELIESSDRNIVDFIIKQNDYIDLIVPRGGRVLIDYVVKNSTVPVLQTGAGICHIFVDESADVEKALAVVDNAKTQRPGTCNAVETLLVHKNIANDFLPKLKEVFDKKNVEIRGCDKTQQIIECLPATEEDWATEYLDLIISIKIVDSIDDAIEHIREYSTGHSEAILTENYTNAMKFINSIDSAVVYVNASTRFTDGGQFGMGAELGISTQKLHARGPVGLRELTSTKFVVFGNYQVRR